MKIELGHVTIDVKQEGFDVAVCVGGLRVLILPMKMFLLFVDWLNSLVKNGVIKDYDE